MGIDTILESIERDAAEEAEARLASAGEEAARIRADAEASAERRVAAAVAAAEPHLRAEAARVVNAARLALLRRRAELAADRSEVAWREASTRLEAIAAEGGRRWRRALEHLTLEALELAGPGATIRVRPVDRAFVADVARKRRAGVETADPDAPPGPVVRSADGRLEIDATLPARLERARRSFSGA
jgi:V/A-type H+-transporting ATPase subunit E